MSLIWKIPIVPRFRFPTTAWTRSPETRIRARFSPNRARAGRARSALCPRSLRTCCLRARCSTGLRTSDIERLGARLERHAAALQEGGRRDVVATPVAAPVEGAFSLAGQQMKLA